MAVFVTKEFARFRRKARLSTEKLLDAASEVADGRFDADLALLWHIFAHEDFCDSQDGFSMVHRRSAFGGAGYGRELAS
jgi:RelE toxin of RelE / RelB toxin-antitoxin system